MKKSSGGADTSPEKASGLMLKVVVLKVGSPWQTGIGRKENSDCDLCRLATSRQRIRVARLIQ
jgi:hypothetical protein